jgi:hypothetical protein
MFPDTPAEGWCGEHPHFAIFLASWPDPSCWEAEG